MRPRLAMRFASLLSSPLSLSLSLPLAGAATAVRLCLVDRVSLINNAVTTLVLSS